MSGLAWKMRRLKAMPAGEIWHRTANALRDAVHTPDYFSWSSDQAFRRLFRGSSGGILAGSRLPELVRFPSDPAPFAAELAAARGLLRGEWTLFGHWVGLDRIPEWRRDYVTGRDWPELPSPRIDYRRTDSAGGVKYVWELGRLTMLPTLALAYRLTGQDACGERAIYWLNDWTSRNPFLHGVHYTSRIEMAVRVLTVSFALALLGERAELAALEPILGLLAQQALYCRDHLSLGSSANNHLIAEYSGLSTMGALFPQLQDAEDLLEQGHAGLEREVLRQIHEDGVPAEQSFGYLPFIWELLLYGFLAAERAGRATSSAVRQRLLTSLEFARAIRLPDGRWPQVGDEDDGRLLLAAEGPSRLDLVGNAMAAWLEADALSDDAPGLALLLFGRQPAAARRARERCHQFPAGGYTVWHERGMVGTWDHGPLGLGTLAAHGHADALSVTLFRGKDPIVVDPGSFSYYKDLEARDRFRSTPYHSTIVFDGRSQSEMAGPFLWGRRSRLEKRDQGYECVWTTGERHWRRVELVGERMRISDQVKGKRAELVFVLHPSAQVELHEGRAVVTVGDSRATFEAQGIQGWRLEPGEYSSRFGHREETRRLVAHLAGAECGTVVTVGGN